MYVCITGKHLSQFFWVRLMKIWNWVQFSIFKGHFVLFQAQNWWMMVRKRLKTSIQQLRSWGLNSIIKEVLVFLVKLFWICDKWLGHRDNSEVQGTEGCHGCSRFKKFKKPIRAWWGKLVNLLWGDWNCGWFEVEGSTPSRVIDSQAKHSSLTKLKTLQNKILLGSVL